MVCFLETVIRDRANGRLGQLPIEFSELEDWRCAAVAPERDLRVIDLRAEGAMRIGVPSDAIRASAHALGNAWGAAFWEHGQEPDGILYPSRLNGDTNLALFDRAMPAMSLAEVRPLLDLPEMPSVIDALELAIV